MVTALERKGMRANYIDNHVKAVKFWLAHNGIFIQGRIKLSWDENKYDNEKPPTPEELQRILDAADLRRKVAVSLMAFAGCREMVLGNYDGSDGLRVKDLPEMTIQDGVVSFQRVPTRVIVRRALSKAKHQYETFLNQQGCQYLKAERLKATLRFRTSHPREFQFTARFPNWTCARYAS